jgi:hypothetical protein
MKGDVKEICSYRLLRCDVSPGKLFLEFINLAALLSGLARFFKAHARLLECGA